MAYTSPYEICVRSLHLRGNCVRAKYLYAVCDDMSDAIVENREGPDFDSFMQSLRLLHRGDAPECKRVGRSMADVLRRRRDGRTIAAILIEGESVARAVYLLSAEYFLSIRPGHCAAPHAAAAL